MKATEAIMEILAAYDLTQSFRDAAELVGCAPNTVIRYVRARDAGGLRTTPVGQALDLDADDAEWGIRRTPTWGSVQTLIVAAPYAG